MRILVVEDDRRIARAIKQGLEQEAYAVDVCYDGDNGYLTAQEEEAYDLIVMDVMLPGRSGLNVSRQLRQQGIATPILLLTAKDQPADVVSGLDSGADDYLAKPFSFEVLLARIRALLRRPKSTAGQVLEVADLSLSPSSKRVERSGQVLNLSTKEYALLEYLMRHRGQVLSKNNIRSHVWDFDADVLPNTVEVFINYLRAKVDKPFRTKPLIQTVRGFGYKIDD